MADANYVNADNIRDLEDGEVRWLSKDSPVDVRNGFVRKVYGIVTAQLILTTAIAGFIRLCVPLETVSSVARPLMLFSLVFLFGITCYISVKPDSMRKSPQNYIMLLLFTVVESILVGVICCAYQAASVLLALGITVGIFAALTIFACTTKTDFTGCGGFLFACLLGLIISGLVLMLFPSQAAQTAQAGIGAVIFSFYIIYDTQLIMGGRHKKGQFSIDDYAWAALNIYLDIINLFLYILEIVGKDR